MIINTEAVVLNSRKYGETSKIVTLFTKEIGKITVIAKGARSIKNKFGSSLDPLSYSFISFYKKPQRDLHLLSKSELHQPLRRIFKSFKHITAGMIILEAINQSQDLYIDNDTLFKLLTDSIFQLNKINANPFSQSTFLLIKLAEILGFGIDFSLPKSPDTAISNQSVCFSLEDGKFIDVNRNYYKMGIDIAIYFNELSRITVDKAWTISINEKNISKIHDFFVNYFSLHLDKRIYFRSLDLLKTQINLV